MPFYKFERNDIFHNRIKTHPQVNFFIYTGSYYYNNEISLSGTYSINDRTLSASVGAVSLYELNINRDPNQTYTKTIYPFIVKGGSNLVLKPMTASYYNKNTYGSTLTGSYPMSASICRPPSAITPHNSSRASSFYYPADGLERSGTAPAFGGSHDSNLLDPSKYYGGTGSYFNSLKNVLTNYSRLSPYFAFSSSDKGDAAGWNKAKQEMRIIDIPSIFYGSSIKKGSVSLKFFISGTQAQEVTDYLRDGVLRTSGSNTNANLHPNGVTGSGVAGVVLYNEGIIMLTGSWLIDEAHTDDNYTGAGAAAPRWIDFGATGSTGADKQIVSSSFNLAFSGTNYVPTLTMLAHAPKGRLNQSNNPTFIKHGQSASIAAFTSSFSYRENQNLQIKNIVKSNFTGSEAVADFEKTTYISQIGIYDKNKNLIGVAKLATPVRKREIDDYTFKLKLDF